MARHPGRARLSHEPACAANRDRARRAGPRALARAVGLAVSRRSALGGDGLRAGRRRRLAPGPARPGLELLVVLIAVLWFVVHFTIARRAALPDLAPARAGPGPAVARAPAPVVAHRRGRGAGGAPGWGQPPAGSTRCSSPWTGPAGHSRPAPGRRSRGLPARLPALDASPGARDAALRRGAARGGPSPPRGRRPPGRGSAPLGFLPRVGHLAVLLAVPGLALAWGSVLEPFRLASGLRGPLLSSEFLLRTLVAEVEAGLGAAAAVVSFFWWLGSAGCRGAGSLGGVRPRRSWWAGCFHSHRGRGQGRWMAGLGAGLDSVAYGLATVEGVSRRSDPPEPTDPVALGPHRGPGDRRRLRHGAGRRERLDSARRRTPPGLAGRPRSAGQPPSLLAGGGRRGLSRRRTTVLEWATARRRRGSESIAT